VDKLKTHPAGWLKTPGGSEFTRQRVRVHTI